MSKETLLMMIYDKPQKYRCEWAHRFIVTGSAECANSSMQTFDGPRQQLPWTRAPEETKTVSVKRKVLFQEDMVYRNGGYKY